MSTTPLADILAVAARFEDRRHADAHRDLVSWLDRAFASCSVAGLTEYAQELGVTPRSRSRWAALHAIARGAMSRPQGVQ